MDPDFAIRLAAFRELDRLTAIYGPVLRWQEIAQGFDVGDRNYLFAGQAVGIFRPDGMQGGALSIKTTVPRGSRLARYNDREGDAGVFRYDMQGDDPNNFHNRLLRVAYEQQLPLIYFFGVKHAVYRPLWPVFITGFDAERLAVTVQVDDETTAVAAELVSHTPHAADVVTEKARRAYVTVLAKRRLHQDVFRENVLVAYQQRCTICRMPRRELLDAAHIIPDSDERGDPVVQNGLSLCKLHHSAFDADLLGIKASGEIVLAKRLLDAKDGPTLEHGLKGFHQKLIVLPRDKKLRPDPDRLNERFARFEISAKSA